MSVLPCAQKGGRERRRGKKREIYSSEANTIPNSQYITLILAGGSLLFCV